MPDPTPQQSRAVAHRASSVVLSSGAGCGKTSTLTERYLAHLRDGATVAQIVAITFTDRAARMMRQRIRVAVERETGDVWKTHLRDLEAAAVTTFHGFCGSLLRRFAEAADIDPQFEQLDDALAAGLRTDAVADSLHKLLTADTPATDDLHQLVVLFGWQAVKEAVEELLLEPDTAAWQTWASRDADEIAADWLGPQRREILAAWGPHVCRAVPKVARCLDLLRSLDPPSPEAKFAREFLLHQTPRLHEATNPAAAVEELVAKAKFGNTGKRLWGDDWPTVKDAMTDFRDAIRDKMTAFAIGPGDPADAARVGQMFVRVALVAATEYQRRKRAANGCDFPDLLVKARDLLRDHPSAVAAVRKQYRHLLLDELQDTDPVQMELVQLLAGDEATTGKVFAVGDAKQSIYRFRGAEVALFAGLRESVPAAGRHTLSVNFRSRPGVIRFVNALCRGWFPEEALLAAHRDEAAACVEFVWAVSGKEDNLTPQPPLRFGEGEPESVSPLSASERGAGGVRSLPAKESAADIRRREAAAVADRIVELQAAGTPLGDIVVLLRSMTHVATYETALRKRQLDYYLVGGRAFFAQQEVYDLLNVLRAVENPHDAASLVGVLRSPYAVLTDDAVHLIATHPSGPWAGLTDPERIATLPADQRPAAKRAAEMIAGWRAVKDRLPTTRLLHRIFADSGADAATQFEFLADRKLANLWKLVDLARRFDRPGFDLPDFIARLADQVVRQPKEEQAATQPENADVVRLMTVHQAKGLEFPVVIVPDLNAAVRPRQYPVARWDRRLGCLVKLPMDIPDAERDDGPLPFAETADRLGRTADELADHAEGLRLLYVACTRAAERLILSAGLDEWPVEHPAGPWLRAIAARYELASGDCIAADVPVNERERVGVTVVPPVAVADERGEERIVPDLGTLVVLPPATPGIPAVVSLPAVERFIQDGEVASLADTHGPPGWATTRERLDPMPIVERAFWQVARRWTLRDADGWQQPLADVLADAPHSLSDQLAPLFGRFAASPLREKLAADGRWEVEFLLDLRTAAAESDSLLRDPLPTLRGLVDAMYRDAAGWHLVAIHLIERSGRDPWRDRLPGLTAAAWAARASGETIASVGLLDLVAGDWTAEPAKKLKFAAAFGKLSAWVEESIEVGPV